MRTDWENAEGRRARLAALCLALLRMKREFAFSVRPVIEFFGGVNFKLSTWFDPTSIGLNANVTVYVGFIAVLANLLVAVIVTLICKAIKAPDGVDLTTQDDYFADEGDPRIGPPTAERPAEPALL